MPVLHNLVRVAGVLTACALLTATGPAAAAPADSGVPTEDAAALLSAITAATETAAPSDWFAAYGETLNGLQALGVEPFLYPTAAPFCLGGTTLGMAPAVAGTIPGPWPRYTVSIPGLDLTAVKAGQAMFAFVPYGLSPDGAETAGMQVVWLNLSTGRGGATPMGPLSTVLNGMIPTAVPAELRPVVEQAVQDFFAGALPRGGVRAVPVDTGSGTVLAAIFGYVNNAGRSCFFFPTVGITPVP
ncbi:hypothetical protein [Nocardia huaxiensis]|uniref:Uncharacterized protein n=1 Tax=Nocardia huaxiensis TaxID=2755382 RepID=A0A7D6VNE0_9NOCA|nr:hypothetical protein [Nocardia huaxiensis]QLY33610.1 hypothetical protein H0264_16450 [Nocardia huaxiensis]UFS99473.1 hypothetical protein LPY97_17075 [Nocardia huaxiensis]